MPAGTARGWYELSCGRAAPGTSELTPAPACRRITAPLQVAPVVKTAVEAAAPVVEKGVKTTVEYAAPALQVRTQLLGCGPLGPAGACKGWREGKAREAKGVAAVPNRAPPNPSPHARPRRRA